MEKNMRTYKEVLEDGIHLLDAVAIEEAGLDAWLLLEYAANINRAWYYAHMDEILDKKTESRYLEMCAKRAQHIPLQHITGRAYFMGYEFCVDERVLVPRQDTEVLVETALTHLKDSRSPKVLDMCTGSGCILLSLLMERQDASGTGVDISEGALAVAKQNRVHLQLEDRAEFVQSDLFSGGYFKKNSGNTISHREKFRGLWRRCVPMIRCLRWTGKRTDCFFTERSPHRQGNICERAAG